MRTYFAHPVTDYGTPLEAAALAALTARLGNIVNPAEPHHGVAYQAEGMAYFERLIEDLDALAFMRFPDGSIGAGVEKEIETAFRVCADVYEIKRDGLGITRALMMPIGPFLSVDETRALIRQLRQESTR